MLVDDRRDRPLRWTVYVATQTLRHAGINIGYSHTQRAQFYWFVWGWAASCLLERSAPRTVCAENWNTAAKVCSENTACDSPENHKWRQFGIRNSISLTSTANLIQGFIGVVSTTLPITRHFKRSLERSCCENDSILNAEVDVYGDGWTSAVYGLGLFFGMPPLHGPGSTEMYQRVINNSVTTFIPPGKFHRERVLIRINAYTKLYIENYGVQ